MKLSPLKLRVELYKRNMTQAELSKKTGFTRNCISGICNGKSCRDDTAYKIADALGVSILDIMEVRQ